MVVDALVCSYVTMPRFWQYVFTVRERENMFACVR